MKKDPVIIWSAALSSEHAPYGGFGVYYKEHPGDFWYREFIFTFDEYGRLHTKGYEDIFADPELVQNVFAAMAKSVVID